MIKLPFKEETTTQRLREQQKERMEIFLLLGGQLRGAVIHATRMINEMRVNHGLGILETLTLGHAYIAAGLMAANLKGEDRIGLQIDCSGPIRGLQVEANAFGEVRGFLKNVPIPIDKPLESFDLSPFFGAGLLSVSKHLRSARQPFTGTVALLHGTIAKDLANYYLVSEQLPTAFHLSIQFDRQGNVTGAGGLLIQAMPEADATSLEKLEKHVADLPSLGKAFAKGQTPEAFLKKRFNAFSLDILASRRVEFMCHCNQDRLRNLLMVLPVDEIQDILENGPFPLETDCRHCGTRYCFDREEIQRIYGARLPNN